MLSTLLSPKDIIVNLESTEKEECFAELLEVIIAKQPYINRTEALNALIAREDKMSTAIFPYVAVPHTICKSVKKTAIVVGISHNGIEFESIDSNQVKKPIVNIVFEILFEQEDTELRLHILRDILQLVSQPNFVNNISKVKTSQEAYEFITSMEL